MPTDAEIKAFFAGNPTGEQIAQQAAQLGMNQNQVNAAMATAGYGGADAGARDATIQNYLGGQNTYQFGAGGGGSLQAQGGMNIPGGGSYTPQQVQDFYKGGGNDAQFLQQAGITDLGQIHDLAIKARGMAGAANPTGDAALQQNFQRYQQANPGGAFVNNYQGFVNDLNPATAAAIRGGGYTGAPTTQTDYGFGGIYGPGTASYGQPGYASGLGPQGNGGSWGAPTASTPAAPNRGGAFPSTGASFPGGPGVNNQYSPAINSPLNSSLFGANGFSNLGNAPAFTNLRNQIMGMLGKGMFSGTGDQLRKAASGWDQSKVPTFNGTNMFKTLAGPPPKPNTSTTLPNGLDVDALLRGILGGGNGGGGQ